MKKSIFLFAALFSVLCLAVLFFSGFHNSSELSSKFEIYKVDLKKQSIELFWKDDKGAVFKNFENLKEWLKGKKRELRFAMNGGMFHEGNTPVGLYIEKGKELIPVDTNQGVGNFYLKPNGIFYITKDKEAGVTETRSYSNNNILYATQSGPMLVVNNKIHAAFNKSSANLTIRNGVGVASPTEIYFVISKEKVNFYEMAQLFKEELNCSNALYLDGFVSKMYLPEKNKNDLGGNFGVIIGVTN